MTFHMEHCTLDSDGATTGLQGHEGGTETTVLNAYNNACFDAGTNDYDNDAGVAVTGADIDSQQFFGVN